MIVRRVCTRGAFGILDYKWDSSLPEFQRFNLIYGWNRSGKTTLSRVFAALQSKSVEFRQYPENGQFEIHTDTGSQVRQETLSASGLAVRVFNKDFVDDNVLFDSSACKAIVYISAEDIASRNRLGELNAGTEALVSARNTAQTEREAADREVIGFLESTALNIKNTVGNLKVADQYRTYNKRILKTFLDGWGVESGDELAEAEFESYKALIAGDAKTRYANLPKFMPQLEVGNQKIDNLLDFDSVLRHVLACQVTSEAIDRLKDDPDLNAWVKAGFDWQREREVLEKCPYCESRLEKGFIERLIQHFSDEYRELDNAVHACLSALDVISVESLIGDADLYSEFLASYKDQIQATNGLLDEFSKWIAECRGKLEEKAKDLLSIVASPCGLPRRFQRRFNAHVGRVNCILGDHNAKLANHDDDVRNKKEKLERHIVAETTREQDYKKMTQRVHDAEAKEEISIAALKNHIDEITQLEKRTSDIGSAVDAINGYLADLFGDTEIQLILDADGQGYVINREDCAATNLSEGEKTALAFAYFLAKLMENSFDLQEGVVVIDDPISSLDSNFTYHCFSLIQRQIGGAGQLFILTHNFAFFGLVKAWFNGKNRKRNRRNQSDCCSFYTIENRTVDGRRLGCLAAMDPTLRRFNSEYQYLFAKLNRFAGTGAPQFEDLYTIGNIARRFLEIYTGFKIPTTGDLRGKVERLPTVTITGAQKDRVYRLVQEFSHAEDPTCAVGHRDRYESQEAIRILLRIVEESDPPHFSMLSANVPE